MEKILWQWILEQMEYIEKQELLIEELRNGIYAAKDMLDGALALNELNEH